MEMRTNIPLKDYVTMRLGGPARFMATVTSTEELQSLIERTNDQSLAYIVLGGGSNIIFEDTGFDGLVILNRIAGFEIIESKDGTNLIRIGAGEMWDDVVKKTVEMGLSGIECMSGIPGTAGATPVQNVGAYGQEIADTLVELEAYDTKTKTMVKLSNADCQFTYRNSLFKEPSTRRHIITSITLRLRTTQPKPPFYESLERYLNDHHITTHSPEILRQAVLEIRRDKLPDPSVYPNSGSFFRNPIIDTWQYEDLKKIYPDMPHFPMNDKQVKIPAGWLIDQAGLKKYRSHGCRTYEKNALVIVNQSANSTADLNAFKEEIRQTVRDTFRITLIQEPEQV